VGPFTRKGLVGSRPADGPGSTLGRRADRVRAGPQRIARKELELTPAETSGVKFENGVFW
jgi:hypothetical protein